VSPKRRDRVAPPAGPDEWDVRFGTSEAAKGWEALCQQAPGNTADAWREMRTNPRPRPDHRHGPLHGDLATKVVEGYSLEQWQIEVTGGGRIWYAIDDDRRTVWLIYASTRHPKATDR
jgi:hypothetical protein